MSEENLLAEYSRIIQGSPTLRSLPRDIALYYARRGIIPTEETILFVTGMVRKPSPSFPARKGDRWGE